MAITEISVSKIYVLATEPTNKVKDRFWFDTTNNLLKRYDGTSWKPISVSSDDVVVLSSGNKISLTNYLNTQIAALAEGIDSKQDKLKYYSEGNSYPSAVIGDTSAAINFNAPDLSMFAIGNITINSDTGLIIDTTVSGSAISTSLPSSIDAASDNKILSEKAVTTALLTKQDKLTTYKELSSEYYDKQVRIDAGGGIYINGGEVGTIFENQFQVTAQAGIIDLDGDYTNLKGDQFNITADEFCLSANSLSGSTTIVSAISSTARDNKIPTEKAVADAISTKQNKLNFYSEVSGSTPSATISVANIKLNGKVAEGYETTASGYCSHAEGWDTTASGSYSHAEGRLTTASGSYSHAEGISTTASGDFSHAEGRLTTASSDYQHVQGQYNIIDANNKYADIIGNGSSDTRSNAATVSWDGISWSQTDVRAGGTDQDAAAHSLAAKQNSTDTALNTTDKTIVGAINEIKSLVIGNTLPTPITDVKTITTTLENLITDTQYANKPGTILINPAITNVGTILVGEGITDLNKAFPIYTDQPVTIAFKNINDFKVAGNIAGDKFNYIISFGYINTNIVSDNLKITTTNGVYEITPEGDAESMTLKLSKIS